jgi:short-subunit dehydrogenase
MYSAAGAGVINFIGSISSDHKDGIRCDATCPGIVKTTLQNADEWKVSPLEYVSILDKNAYTVETLLNGDNMEERIQVGKRQS